MEKEKMFYQRLNALKISSKKSFNQIERELGYPRNALQNYRNGGEASSIRLMEIAKYFKVSPEYLLGMDIKEDDKTILEVKYSGEIRFESFSKKLNCKLFYDRITNCFLLRIYIDNSEEEYTLSHVQNEKVAIISYTNNMKLILLNLSQIKTSPSLNSVSEVDYSIGQVIEGVDLVEKENYIRFTFH